MDYRTELVQVEQFQRNTNEVHNWFDNTDASLDQATKALQRMRELAVKASNDTYGPDERRNIAAEVEQLKNDLIELANTKVNDKYLFNGTDTSNPPFTEDGVINDENPDDKEYGTVFIEVAKGTKLDVNVTAEDAGFTELFKNIDEFIGKLRGDGEDIGASIEKIDDGIDHIINARADLGARMNRLDLVENRLSEQQIIATKTMSQNEDVDYAKTITKLVTQESLHRAALSAGARIIQPTLLDFLR